MEEAGKPDKTYTYFILPMMPGRRSDQSVGGLSACLPLPPPY